MELWDGAVMMSIIACGVGIKVEWIRGGGGAWEDNVVPRGCDGTFDVLATMGWYAEGIAPPLGPEEWWEGVARPRKKTSQ